jgi:MFS family permease
MNSPRTVIGFVNAAHFIDHYAMLIFAAAVIVMAPIFGMRYAQLLPYATPGFIAFGAASLVTGWLGDRWSRRHMIAIFFFGIGFSMMATGLTRTPGQLGLALFAIGLFAAIYHAVGPAMLVAHAETLGRAIGMNGVWGNLGVASAALVTGLLCQHLGWQWAFLIPGVASALVGAAFMCAVADERRDPAASAPVAAHVPPAAMKRVILALVVTIIASSTTFNAITVAMPQLFTERLSGLTRSPTGIGFIAAAVYMCGALAQYMIGRLLDRHSLKAVFMPMAFLLAPLLVLAAHLNGLLLVLISIGIVVGIFGQVTINDAMVAKYTSDEWRARAFAARYFLGFTAAGASVTLVAWLHARGGFTLMLQAFGALCVLVIAGAMIFPKDRSRTGS